MFSKNDEILELTTDRENGTKEKAKSVAHFKQSSSVAEEYWEKCISIIKDNVSNQVFQTWFLPIKAVKYEDNTLTISVPSQFFYEWIEEHYFPLIQKTLVEVIGVDAILNYHIVVDDSSEKGEQKTIKLPGNKIAGRSLSQSQLPFAENPFLNKEYPTFLNQRYTFENFIKGDSNQMASSAAFAVSQNPGGTKFNPLFIYGDTGLGKTHLVQALGNKIVEKHRKLRVMYTTSERFTMEFINAIQMNKVNEFTNFYRSIDVLIVDDIQFLSGKEKTQDNFFHTFNALHQAGKQIILTSDKAPRALSDVDSRLISRFQWGLIADIQSPDFEMRMAILKQKSKDEGFELPIEIIDYIAKNVVSSIRELEGTLISLIAKVTLDRRELNLDLAKEIINGVRYSSDKPITIEDIKEAVSQQFDISIELMESKSRKQEIALARQMAMFLAKKFTTLSLKSIGASFGNRDHSTVLHSCQAIENYLVTDKTVKASYETLLKKFQKV
ncbi:MAG: chromosomal replication initiator protein DnaA [Candidatus Kapabacteria bacterium]|nr:chromosomal replication initiator protein DnaA [Candidatus Kapabacteria bacterium]